MAVKKRLVRETIREYKHKGVHSIGVAWYKPEQWDLLKAVSEDRDELENTYTEWLEYAEKALREFRLKGIYLDKVEVDVEELSVWCKEKKVPVNGDSRVDFVIHKQKNRSN